MRRRVPKRWFCSPSLLPVTVTTLRPRYAFLPGVSHTTAGKCAWDAVCSSGGGVDGGEHSPGLEVENGARVRAARVCDRVERRRRRDQAPSLCTIRPSRCWFDDARGERGLADRGQVLFPPMWLQFQRPLNSKTKSSPSTTQHPGTSLALPCPPPPPTPRRNSSKKVLHAKEQVCGREAGKGHKG